MSKVSSKLRITIPKRIADACGIVPGDEIEFIAAGASIRVVKCVGPRGGATTAERLALYDRATARQKKRQRAVESRPRGWTRDGLYNRGRTR